MEEGIRHTFPKEERLCGKTSIELLIARGKYHTASPLRCCFLAENCQEHSRMMVSVPKKFFKRAVKRNLLKRRIRECWRKQKHMIPEGHHIDILFTYTSKEVSDYGTIYESAGSILNQISKNIKAK